MSTKNRKIVKGSSPFSDKIFTIFECLSNGKFKCYNIVDKYFELTSEEKAFYIKNPRSTKYIFIKKNERDNDLKYLSIRKQCKSINKEAEKLLILTKGKINLYRTGSPTNTSLQLFYDLCDNIEPEHIEDYEVNIFEKCRGALIFGIPYEGIGYKYDIVSEYPSIMNSAQHKFPIKKGTLKTYTKEEFDNLKFYTFGLYHVEIHNIDFRVFRNNPENWYSHSELNFAITKLKLKITLIIENEEPNALLYDANSLITGKNLFGPFVKYLFNFKDSGNSEIKKYLSNLWGKLCSTNVIKITNAVIYENKEIMSILPNDDGTLTIETFVKSKFYDFNYARIKPFLMAYGRLKIANIILPNIENIVRTHTDGIISKVELTINTGYGLGDLKKEGKGNCKILNNNNYIWNEIK